MAPSDDYARTDARLLQRSPVDLKTRMSYAESFASNTRKTIPDTIADDGEGVPILDCNLFQIAKTASRSHREFNVALAEQLRISFRKRLLAMTSILAVLGDQKHLRRGRQRVDLFDHVLSKANADRHDLCMFPFLHTLHQGAHFIVAIVGHDNAMDLVVIRAQQLR